MNDKELLEYCNEFLKYDPESGVFTWIKIPAPCIRLGKIAGCKNHWGYMQIRIKGKIYKSHRLAFLITYKYLPEMIDHINHDKADNRIDNLRGCTRFENMRNRPLQKNSKSGYKGVCWMTGVKKWRAHIKLNNKENIIGNFSCKHRAAEAYNEKAKELFGEFAWLNPIRES